MSKKKYETRVRDDEGEDLRFLPPLNPLYTPMYPPPPFVSTPMIMYLHNFNVAAHFINFISFFVDIQHTHTLKKTT